VGHALGEAGEDWGTRGPDRQFRGEEFAPEHPTSPEALAQPKAELSCLIYAARSQLSTWPGTTTTAYGANALRQLLGLTHNSLFFNGISAREMC